ncbi:hypothetical protein SAMN04487946_1132 [Halobellus clavatus]|uniref:Uncharacterized protein n=1 Tax=Halobellus clavatus TaxID=660517 RepID=A0A1H3JC02_9EURY|nr:hypothetical protein SAMN04487946_1132 [Halobellus clavatus]
MRSTIPLNDYQFPDQHPSSSTGDLGWNWWANSEKLVGEWTTGTVELAVRGKQTTRDLEPSEATPITDAPGSEIDRAAQGDTGVTTRLVPISGSAKSRTGGIGA